MKNVLFAIMVLILASCQPKDLPTVLEVRDGYALMKISHQTTKDELKDIQQKLADYNIALSYEGSTFFDNNRLQNVVLQVKTPEGHSGNTKADIVALQYRYFGFLYQKGGSPAFKIGEELP
ncbi:MAG: hypothetical protein J5I52_01080 [Saprospiraceae bacterium]|nr:MAG: hypothetical protein UZ09_BCD002002185 [Bacteroidetes bacterium OLB9]MCO6462718.1 hypothetical protein [Saprospiraceae bacterium]MCZ2340021.1 hypothetical protein [Chitinophagales bacterium]